MKDNEPGELLSVYVGCYSAAISGWLSKPVVLHSSDTLLSKDGNGSHPVLWN